VPCRGVAQKRARSAGEHRREETRFSVRRRVAHAEDAAMLDDQGTLQHTSIDCRRRDARGEQLPAGDQPVLPRRDPGQ